MDMKTFEVPVEKLRWQCDPAIFDFDCTNDMTPLREVIGQDRTGPSGPYSLAYPWTMTATIFLSQA